MIFRRETVQVVLSRPSTNSKQESIRRDQYKRRDLIGVRYSDAWPSRFHKFPTLELSSKQKPRTGTRVCRSLHAFHPPPSRSLSPNIRLRSIGEKRRFSNLHGCCAAVSRPKFRSFSGTRFNGRQPPPQIPIRRYFSSKTTETKRGDAVTIRFCPDGQRPT